MTGTENDPFFIFGEEWHEVRVASDHAQDWSGHESDRLKRDNRYANKDAHPERALSIHT